MMSVPYHLSVASPDAPPGPQNHRTVDRVTQILEEVTYRPGITFTELARALGAPKSSVHGFVRGLLAKGRLYEDDKHSGTQYALATAVRDQSGEAIADITLVGLAAGMPPREKRLRKRGRPSGVVPAGLDPTRRPPPEPDGLAFRASGSPVTTAWLSRLVARHGWPHDSWRRR